MLLAVCNLCLQKGISVGVGEHEGDDWENDWRKVIYLELPTGQISFHIHDSESGMFSFLPKYFGKWDGHNTDQKWQRLFDWSSRF